MTTYLCVSPRPQVAKYVWHRRDLMALNLSRVDFLLGESQHPRVPQPRPGALGDPWPVPGCWDSWSGQLPPGMLLTPPPPKGCWYPPRTRILPWGCWYPPPPKRYWYPEGMLVPPRVSHPVDAATHKGCWYPPPKMLLLPRGCWYPQNGCWYPPQRCNFHSPGMLVPTPGMLLLP